MMRKKIFLVMICLVFFVLFVSALHGQSPKKTTTLSKGEVIWDLNGDWDIFLENYGIWSQFGRGLDVAKITQQGSSFEGIRMMGTGDVRKGTLSIKGELDKNGFSKIQLYYPSGGFLDGKGQISEDGNKMVIDDGEKLRVTYTRK